MKFSKFQGKLIQGDTPWTRAARTAMLKGAPPPAVKKQSQKLWGGFKVPEPPEAHPQGKT